MHTHSPHLSRLRRLVFLVAMIFIQNFSQSGSAPNRKATKHVEIPSIKHHQSYSVCAISSAHANEAPHSPNLLLLQISYRHLHTRPSSGGNGLEEGPSIHPSMCRHWSFVWNHKKAINTTFVGWDELSWTEPNRTERWVANGLVWNMEWVRMRSFVWNYWQNIIFHCFNLFTCVV